MNEEKIISQLSMIKHRIFPRPFERLGAKGRNLAGVEIGVGNGFHAESILQHLDISKLYLVDIYQPYMEYGRVVDFSSSEAEAKRRLERFGDKIEFIKKLSGECFNEIPNKLDFVYIDGNHEYKFVKQDIENYFPKIKAGGVIGGHDFYNGYARMHDGVVKAASEFAVGNKLELQVELPDWWIRK